MAPLTPPSPAGNYNLDGPIYLDLQKRMSKAGGPPVWQVLDAYYGEQGRQRELAWLGMGRGLPALRVCCRQRLLRVLPFLQTERVMVTLRVSKHLRTRFHAKSWVCRRRFARPCGAQQEHSRGAKTISFPMFCSIKPRQCLP